MFKILFVELDTKAAKCEKPVLSRRSILYNLTHLINI